MGKSIGRDRVGGAARKRGAIPAYWWDFRHEGDGSMSIVIETTDTKVAGGVICSWPVPDGPADRLIGKAVALIADLRAGRKTLTQVMG